jgi:dipeptidyl aminopeptidase/acylaminoacyl peptidase
MLNIKLAQSGVLCLSTLLLAVTKKLIWMRLFFAAMPVVVAAVAVWPRSHWQSSFAWRHPDDQGWLVLDHGDIVRALSFDPSGRYLATGGFLQSDEAQIRVWEVDTGRLRATLPTTKRRFLSLSFAGDQHTLLSANLISADRWDVDTGTAEVLVDRFAHCALKVAFAPDGRSLLYTDRRGAVRLRNTVNGQERRLLTPAIEMEVGNVAFAADGGTVAAADVETLRVWDVATGATRLEMPSGDPSLTFAVALAPNGAAVACVADLQDASIIDVATGRERVRCRGSTDWIYCLAFSPDGRLLAAGDKDQRVILWDVDTGRELIQFQGHTEPVSALAFSPDGTWLASGSSDHTVRLWRLPQQSRGVSPPRFRQEETIGAFGRYGSI